VFVSADNLTSLIINAICLAFALWQLVHGVRTGRVFTGMGDATRDDMPAAFRMMLVLYAVLVLIFAGAAVADVSGITVQFFPLRIS
jgi:predicted small integral membrane protein